MAIFGNTFEGGTDGTTITAGNSGVGSDDPYGTSIGANSTLTYSVESAFHGNLGMRVETTAINVSSFVQQDITSADRIALRFYFKAEVIPSSATVIAQMRALTPSNLDIRFHASGSLMVANASGVEISGTRTTNPLVAGTWYRIEIAANPGGSASSGVVNFAYYVGDSTTALNSFTVSGVDLGSAQVARYRLGRVTSSAHIGVFHFDDAKTEDLETGFVGSALIDSEPPSGGAAFSNSFEGGTNGTTITTANSGGASGDPYGTSIGANSTLTFASASAYHGNMGLRSETTATNVVSFIQQEITPADRNAIRFYFKADTIPSVVTNISQLRGASGAAAQVVFHTSGRLYLSDINNVEINGTRTTNPLVAGTWYRIEYAVTPGLTTTSGVVNFAYYLGDSLSPLNDFTAPGVNAGSGQSIRYRIGRPSASTHIGVFHFDDAKAQDLSSGYIGPEQMSAGAPHEMVWSGSAWLASSESERIWASGSWS